MKFQGKSVLIIDDDPDFRILLKKILTTQGMAVREAHDLKSAVSVLNEFAPDLVVLDLNLENEHGSSYLKARKENSILSAIPVIVCSAENAKMTVEKVLTLGCDDYILKPIKTSIVLQKLRKIFRDEHKLIHVFDKKPKVTLETKANCIAISEAYCQIRSNLKLEENQKLNMRLDFFEKEGLPLHDYRVNIKSWVVDPGVYDCTFTIIGITENDASKLRKLKLSWRPK